MTERTEKLDFFIPGDCKDSFYRVVRDLPEHKEARAFVESLWQRYRGYEDRHFLEGAKSNFLQRSWEMYLAVALLDHELRLSRVGNVGPEFNFDFRGRKVWVEAVAPGPGDGDDRVTECVPGKPFSVPTEKILLRFTNALAEKRSRYLSARQKEIIGPDDLYLLAINSRGIPHAPFGNTLPFFVQAFLPLGDLTYVLDKKCRRISDSFYLRRDTVQKTRGATVATDCLLDEKYSFVSAVLHSAADCVNGPRTLGDDFEVLHNPTARLPLEPSPFAWCKQMYFRSNALEVFPRA